MSGPVTPNDTPTEPGSDEPEHPGIEVTEGRAARVGGLEVRRVLPRRSRRTVGAWCFVDHMGPGDLGGDDQLDVGPHPHIGLQTVTWLFEGAILHRDSLGSEQIIRPGQLNLMTAGHGVAHSEETGVIDVDRIHGIQFWVAQPEATRHGEAAFEHHEDLPRAAFGPSEVVVLVGGYEGLRSPARADTDHVGLELTLRPGETVLPLRPDFEHALVAVDGPLRIGATVLEPGHLGHLGTGRDEVPLRVDEERRAMLIGGTPFDDPVLMWWNYVARTRDEITTAHRDWTARAERFGRVASPIDGIDVPPPPWDEASS